MSEYLEIMGFDELAEGAMAEVGVDGHALLVAKAGGAVYIADARCPHLHGNLAHGTLDGTVVTCPLHGSQFDLVDGTCVRWTGFSGVVKTVADLVRHERPLRVYETLVQDGKVFVGPQRRSPAP